MALPLHWFSFTGQRGAIFWAAEIGGQGKGYRGLKDDGPMKTEPVSIFCLPLSFVSEQPPSPKPQSFLQPMGCGDGVHPSKALPHTAAIQPASPQSFVQN